MVHSVERTHSFPISPYGLAFYCAIAKVVGIELPYEREENGNIRVFLEGDPKTVMEFWNTYDRISGLSGLDGAL